MGNHKVGGMDSQSKEPYFRHLCAQSRDSTMNTKLNLKLDHGQDENFWSVLTLSNSHFIHSSIWTPPPPSYTSYTAPVKAPPPPPIHSFIHSSSLKLLPHTHTSDTAPVKAPPPPPPFIHSSIWSSSPTHTLQTQLQLKPPPPPPPTPNIQSLHTQLHLNQKQMRSKWCENSGSTVLQMQGLVWQGAIFPEGNPLSRWLK